MLAPRVWGGATPIQTWEKHSLRLMKKRGMKAGVLGKAVTPARPDN